MTSSATSAAEGRAKRRVASLWARWKHLVDGWDVRVVYSPGEFTLGEESGDAVAMTLAEWPYLRATVAFNLALAALESDEDLENTVVHEMCHVLVQEMQVFGRYMGHEERVCSSLARAFLKTRQTP